MRDAQVRLRSNHQRPLASKGRQPMLGVPREVATRFVAPPGRYAAPKAALSQAKQKLRAKAQRHERKSLGAEWSKLLSGEFVLKTPGEGIVRAIAREACKLPRSHDRIEDLPSVLVAYATLAMRYHSRYIVQQYVFMRLMQMLDERRQVAAKNVAIHRERLSRDLVRLRRAINAELKPVVRADLMLMAECAFREIEEDILKMASGGRRLGKDSPRDYIHVMGRLGRRSGKTCFMVLEFGESGELIVKSFMTPGEYNRSCRKRFNRRSRQGYSNRPPSLRP